MDEQKVDEIRELGASDAIGGVKIISIIGQVEGHTLVPPQTKATKYEHIIPLLTEAEQSREIRGLLVLLNTMGGDVEAGLAIAELIRGMKKPSVSLVLGGGHSIGVPLAVCSDYSFISPTASMTIHPVRTSGVFITVPKSFHYYNKMQERVVRFICENAKIDEEAFRKLMYNTDELADDTGTVLIGEETVAACLIDSVGGLADALEKLNSMF